MAVVVDFAFDPRRGSFTAQRAAALALIARNGGHIDWEHCEAAGRGRKVAQCAHILSATFSDAASLPGVRRAVYRVNGLTVDAVWQLD